MKKSVVIFLVVILLCSSFSYAFSFQETIKNVGENIKSFFENLFQLPRLAPPRGTTYYVDQFHVHGGTCQDITTGGYGTSWATSWCSIEYGINNMGGGNTLLVADGDYVETTVRYGLGYYTPSGPDENNPTIIRAEGNNVNVDTKDQYGLYLVECPKENITVEGFNFISSTNPLSTRVSVACPTAASITLRDNNVGPSGGITIMSNEGGTSRNHLIENNYIQNGAISIEPGAKDIEILNNMIINDYPNPGTNHIGIMIGGSSSSPTYTTANILFKGNTVLDIAGAAGHGGSIRNAENITFSNNIWFNTWDATILWPYDYIKNITLNHNTVISSRASSLNFVTINGPFSEIVVKNNLFANYSWISFNDPTSLLISELNENYNYYFKPKENVVGYGFNPSCASCPSGRCPTIEAWRTCTQSAGYAKGINSEDEYSTSLNLYTLFVDPDNYDFTPKAGSFVCGKASDGTDIGALPCAGSGTCVDNDIDGYGNPGDASCPNGPATDCNDNNNLIYPGAKEICTDGLDNNCNGFCDFITSTCTDGSTSGDSACTATAKTYYVSKSGTFSTTCASNSQSTPFPTIQQGIDCAITPGDNVSVNPGIYEERLWLDAQGTSDNYITLKANGNVIVNGTGGDGIEIGYTSASYVILDGFKFTNCQESIYVRSTTPQNHDIIVKNCEASQGTNIAIRINNAYNILVDNCTLHDNGGGVSISNSPSYNITVSNSLTYNNAVETEIVDGFASGVGSYDVTFVNCISYNNTAEGFDLQGPGTINNCTAHHNQNGFKFGNSGTSNIFNSISYGNKGFGISAGTYAGSTGNIINCTIVNNSLSAIRTGSTGGGNLNIKNTVAVNPDITQNALRLDPRIPSALVINEDYNDFFSSSFSDYVIRVTDNSGNAVQFTTPQINAGDWYNWIIAQPGLSGSSNTFANPPNFFNEANNDYAPKMNSPLCNGGENGQLIGAIPCTDKCSVDNDCSYLTNISCSGNVYTYIRGKCNLTTLKCYERFVSSEDCNNHGVCEDSICSEDDNGCSKTPKPETFICGASAGICDIAETCDGTNADCPTDAFQPNTFICRASEGPCDIAETCTGSSAICPTINVFNSSSTMCRTSAGACDITDYCSGSSAGCTNLFNATKDICNPSAGPCDIAETCTGSSAICPTINVFNSSSTMCRTSAGACDITDYCSGSSAGCTNLFNSTADVCRVSAGPCDILETCDGTAQCPNNIFQPDNTLCLAASCNGLNDLIFTPVAMCQSGECPNMLSQNCADSVTCTDDSCNALLGCQHVDNCASGYHCDLLTQSCLPNPTCTSDEQCYSLTDQCNIGRCIAQQCYKDPTDFIGTFCNDNQFCTQEETCQLSGSIGICTGGTPKCTSNDIAGITICNNPFYNYRAAFTSICNEGTSSCSTGDQTITHTCNTTCGAQCTTNLNCPSGTCNQLTCTCTTTGQDYTLTLTQGLNLISIPVIPNNFDIEDLFQLIINNLNSIYYYDPLTDSWKAYHKSNPELSTLTTLASKRAYIINMSADANLPITGTENTNLITLSPGWNMIGISSITSIPAATALNLANNKSGYNIWTLQNNNYQIYAGDLQPGKGYWIYISEEGGQFSQEKSFFERIINAINSIFNNQQKLSPPKLP